MTNGSTRQVQFLAPGPIARACRHATTHNSGVTVLGEPEVTPAGTRIRLSSWPRQQEALSALRLLGYQVAEDSRDGEHGAALVVTGWDTAWLTRRAVRLEEAVRNLDRSAPERATAAISRFIGLEAAEGLGEASARERVTTEAGRAARRPYPDHLHASAPVDGDDLLHAGREVGVLLAQVSHGEDAIAAAGARAEQLADTAIRLFICYRVSLSEEKAAERAVREATRDSQPTGLPLGDMLPWRPGDVVLSADLRLFTRANEGWNGGGRWPWCEGVGYAPVNEFHAPEGGTQDSDVIRPVTLLIRGDRAMGGVVIDDRTLQGTLGQGELPAPGEPADQLCSRLLAQQVAADATNGIQMGPRGIPGIAVARWLRI